MILSQVLSLYECSSAFQTSLLPVSLTVPHNHLRRCQNFFCDDQASSSLQVISLSFPFLTSLIRPHFIKMYITWRGSGCSVGIATGYGLDGPGIESLWERDFPHLSRPTLGPTQPPVQWVLHLSRGVKSGRCVTLTPHSLLVPLVMKE